MTAAGDAPAGDAAAGRLRRWLPMLVVGAVLVLLPLVFTGEYQRSVMVRLCIGILLLSGLNLISGYGRMLSLAQAGFYGLGAYTAGISVVKLGLPPEVGLLLAPVVVAVAAWIIGLPALRLRGMYFVMATLGAGVVLYLVFGRAVALTGGPNGLLGIPPLSIGGWQLDSALSMYVLAATLAFLGLLGAHNLMRSRTGRALTALGVSEPGAAVVGVDALRLRIVAFVLSGVYAGIAGAVLAFDTQFVSPSTFDFLTAVVFVVLLVVGGAGTFSGPIVGAVLLVGLEEVLASYADFHPLILGLIFLVTIQVFPEGIVGSARNWWAERNRAAREQQRPPQPQPAGADRDAGGGATA